MKGYQHKVGSKLFQGETVGKYSRNGMMWIIIYGTKEQKWNLWNRVDIEKVPRDERVGTGLLNLIIYQTDIVTAEKEES